MESAIHADDENCPCLWNYYSYKSQTQLESNPEMILFSISGSVKLSKRIVEFSLQMCFIAVLPYDITYCQYILKQRSTYRILMNEDYISQHTNRDICLLLYLVQLSIIIKREAKQPLSKQAHFGPTSIGSLTLRFKLTMEQRSSAHRGDIGPMLDLKQIQRMPIFVSIIQYVDPTLCKHHSVRWHYVAKPHVNNVVLLIGETLVQCWKQSISNVQPVGYMYL